MRRRRLKNAGSDDENGRFRGRAKFHFMTKQENDFFWHLPPLGRFGFEPLMMASSSSPLLAFENQMFLDALSSDGLTVAARGLGMERVMLALIKVRAEANSGRI